MTVENIRMRSKVKSVASINLVLGAIAIIVAIAFPILLLVNFHNITERLELDLRSMAWHIWLVLGIGCAVQLIQMYFDVKLIKYTDQRKDTGRVQSVTDRWIGMSLLRLVVFIIIMAVYSLWVILVFGLLTQLSFISIVITFSGELEAALDTASRNNGPDGISTPHILE